MMAVQQERVTLGNPKAEQMGLPATDGHLVVALVKGAVVAAGRTLIWIFETMMGMNHDQAGKWAHVERVTWYQGCGR